MSKLKHMKLTFMITLFLKISFSGNAQVYFEKGYITLSKSNRTSCYIKNLGWRYNPREVSFKLSENGDVKTLKPEDVSEFEVTGVCKYKGYTVDIDQSEESLNKLSDNKEPEYEKNLVFLKVLAEGKATLLEYETETVTKYFIQFGSENPQPLIHKTYRPDETSAINENNTYQNQLRAWFNSGNISLSDIENVHYNSRELTGIVNKFNKSGDGKAVVYNSTDKKALLHINLRPGVSLNDFFLQNVYYPYRNTHYGYKFCPRIGIEAEITLPFNRNKWAVILEPAYSQYSADYRDGNYHSTITYRSLETYAGPRYYFFLENNRRVFVDAALIIDLPLASKFTENIPYNNYPFQFTIGGAAGVGFKANKRLGIQLRYTFRNPYRQSFSEGKNSNYQGFGIIFSYTIF
jgi:hypothetical protein